MAENYTLDAPAVIPEVVTTTYSIRSVLLDRDAIAGALPPPPAVPEPGLISIALRDNNGAALVCTYQGDKAQSMMRYLNTADLSVKSLHKRILEQLEQDGKLPPGEITGTPE